MAAVVLLSERAVKDLARLGRDRSRIEKVLASLATDPARANLDLKTMRGRAPWSRLRVGSFRVILRRLDDAERTRAESGASGGYLVYRIVRRRDLDRAIAKL